MVDEGEDWKDARSRPDAGLSRRSSCPLAETAAAPQQRLSQLSGAGVEQAHINVAGVGPATNLHLLVWNHCSSDVEASGP